MSLFDLHVIHKSYPDTNPVCVLFEIGPHITFFPLFPILRHLLSKYIPLCSNSKKLRHISTVAFLHLRLQSSREYVSSIFLVMDGVQPIGNCVIYSLPSQFAQSVFFLHSELALKSHTAPHVCPFILSYLHTEVFRLDVGSSTFMQPSGHRPLSPFSLSGFFPQFGSGGLQCAGRFPPVSCGGHGSVQSVPPFTNVFDGSIGRYCTLPSLPIPFTGLYS